MIKQFCGIFSWKIRTSSITTVLVDGQKTGTATLCRLYETFIQLYKINLLYNYILRKGTPDRYPWEYIRTQLTRLTAHDVLAVLEKFRQNQDKIKNLPSYLAAMLLQAPDETALWQIQKAGTAKAVPAQSPSYNLEEWERQSELHPNC